MSTEPSVNPWRAFQALLPGGSQVVVTVVANNGDGTSRVQLRDGTEIEVKGEGVSPPNLALLVDGELKVQVPSLPQMSVEV